MSRNKIGFSDNPDLTICNPTLRDFLCKISSIFNEHVEVTAQVTNMGYVGIAISGELSLDAFNMLKDICNYLEINELIVKNDLLIETINNTIHIQRSFDTFHQNDDKIRQHIHNYFSIIKSDTLLCVGGECYIYPHLIRPNYCCIMTNYQSIFDDAKRNNSANKYIFSDYNNFKLSFDCVFDCIFDTAIFNVSKSGLTESMCYALLERLIPTVYIVSCNEKSHKLNMKILSKRYTETSHICFESDGNLVFIFRIDKYE